MEEYLFQILLRQSSTEYALFMQVDPGLHAHAPLDHPEQLRNPDLPFPVSFIYGTRDWMDSRGALEIVKANKFFASGESQLHVLPDAGHQLFMNNPEGFIKLVVDDLTGALKHTVQARPFPIMYVDANGHPIRHYEQVEAV